MRSFLHNIHMRKSTPVMLQLVQSLRKKKGVQWNLKYFKVLSELDTVLCLILLVKDHLYDHSNTSKGMNTRDIMVAIQSQANALLILVMWDPPETAILIIQKVKESQHFDVFEDMMYLILTRGQ